MIERNTIVAALLLALLSTAALADVKGAWITTDRTVDCSSLETIVAGVIKPDMTDEQKAIAMYDFYRLRVYHDRCAARRRRS